MLHKDQTVISTKLRSPLSLNQAPSSERDCYIRGSAVSAFTAIAIARVLGIVAPAHDMG